MQRFKSVCRFAVHRSPEWLCASVAFLTLLHLTVNDRFVFTFTLVYAFRPFLLGAGLLVASAGWLFRKRPRAAVLTAASAVAVFGWAAGSSLVLNPPPGPAPKDAVRGLCWNLARGKAGWDRLGAAIREADPDIGWFVEAEPEDGSDWHLELKEWQWVEFKGGLLLAVKGQVLDQRSEDLETHSRAGVARVRVRDNVFSCIVVDVNGSPVRSRRPAVERLEEIARGLPPGPVIVAGDFNTPRDSALFGGMRGEFEHAFETVGRGFDGTWPALVPILSIDHAWGRSGVRWQRCEHRRVPESDHRQVHVTFFVR